jgi:hypothetical protein
MGVGGVLGLSVVGCDAWVDAVLGRDSEVVPEGGALVVVAEHTSFLEQGYDLVDEGVDAVFVDVRDYPEAVSGAGFEPFLQVIGMDLSWSNGGGVVVDDAMGEDVAQ